jgi:hypothetical protein
MVIYQEKIAPPDTLPVLTSEPADVRSSDEPSRTDEARQAAEEYVNDLRVILKRFRKLLS